MVKTSGSPRFVYKAFTKKEYAEAFVNEGRFRIGHLNHYKEIEDSNRRDPTEGQAFYKFEDDLQQFHLTKDAEIIETSTTRGLMEVRGSWGNPTYIFCTSLPSVDLAYLRGRFGEHVVQIHDVRQFELDMQEAIVSTGLPFIGKGQVQGKCVEYSKGAVLIADLETVASCHLAYIQKPDEYSPESEFRFVAMMSAISPPPDEPLHIDLCVGRKLEYANFL